MILPKSDNGFSIVKFIIVLLILIFSTQGCDSGHKAKDINQLKVYRKSFKVPLKGKKILLYGDSISSSEYPWYKSALEELTGAEVYAGGFPGYTTSQLAKDAQLQLIFDYKPDIIICLVGGNDAGVKGEVGTFGATDEILVKTTDITKDYSGYTFIQAVAHIIEKIDGHYKMDENTHLLNAENISPEKPLLVFCTTLPQKRSNRFNKFSRSDNWLRKRDAVVECCDKYKVHCIDLYNLCDWDFSKEPYWTPPTDIYTNRGIFTMDGVHPNQKGYEDMARIVYEELALESADNLEPGKFQ